MRRVVVRAIATTAIAALLSTACSAPPQKEIDRAQGALDAARAAGAEQYAPEAFTAATSALQQTHEAVQQRDYRLALSRATDANERALEAATQAADGKARARSEAEAAAAWLTSAIRQVDEHVKAAEAARLPAKEVAAARALRADAQKALQEARAAIAKGDYLAASAATRTVADRVTKETAALADAIASRAPRGPRRRR